MTNKKIGLQVKTPGAGLQVKTPEGQELWSNNNLFEKKRTLDRLGS
ncbi:MAG: hypothetical protein ACKVOU_04550 [Cytophagales bacterium]